MNPNEGKGEPEELKQEQSSPKQELPIVKREVRVVEDFGPLAYINDTARFEHAYRVAESMALAALLPDHLLRNKHGEFTLSQIKGNCFRIVMQAMRWEVDPFALLDETFVTNGKIGYQGKVITAIVNARSGLKERLEFTFSGEEGTDNYTVTVGGTFLNEDRPRTVSLSVGKAKTQNDMWRKDPEQKLIYSGVVRWARRYCPDIILGVTTEDDAERREYWASQQASQPTKAPAKPTRGKKPNFEEKPAMAMEVES
jgi:hypothetical protein